MLEVENLHVKFDSAVEVLTKQLDGVLVRLDRFETVVDTHGTQLQTILDWIQVIGGALGVNLLQKRKQ